MSKNLTLKGAAFGALVALSISAVAPASAAGLADKTFVSLLPASGTEYTVLADQYFDLKANPVSSIATTGNLKFLVEDTNAITKFDVDVNASTADVVTSKVITNGLGVALPTLAGATVTSADPAVVTYASHGLAVGDTIIIDPDGNGTDTFTTVTAVTTNTFTTGVDNTGGTMSVNAAGDIVRVASQSSTTSVTLYSAAHGFLTGDTVTIAGMADINGGTAGDPLNAAQVVTSTTTNSLTFTLATAASSTAVVAADGAETLTRTNSTVLENRTVINRQALGQLGLIGSTPSVQSSFPGVAGWQSLTADNRKSASDGSYVIDSGVASSANDKVVRLTNTGSDSASVVVTAWVDANSNGAIDGTEYTSEPRTVNFKKASEVVATTALTQPEIGDANLAATVTTVPVLNGDQVLAQNANALKVAFNRQGSAGVNDDITASWSDTTKKYSFSVSVTANGTTNWSALSAAVIAGSYSATGYVGTTAGAVSTLGVGAATADNLTATVTSSANITYGESTANDVVTTVAVRKGTNDAVIKVAVLDENDLPVAAGVNVKATVSAFTGTGTYKVNGTTVATSEAVSAATDAAGIATFTVTSSAALAANGLTVNFTSQGISAAADLAAIVLDWADANYSIVDVDDASASTYSSINKGGSRTINFAVVDQFAQSLTGNYRLKVVLSSFKSETIYSSTLSNGRTSVTVSDNAGTNGTGTILVNGALQSFESNAWADADGTNDVGAEALTQQTINVIAAQTDALTLTNDVDATTPGTSDKDANVADTAIAAFDGRFQVGVAPAATDETLNGGSAETGVEVYNDEVAVVAGTVTNSVTAAAKSGAQVTISGAGLTFREGSSNVWAKDSLTVFANNSGAFSFNVATNKAVKDQVVTVTSGAVSKTVKLTFSGIVAKTAAFTGGNVYSAGRTIPLAVEFKDKWGNVTTRGLANNTAATATFATGSTDGGWLVNTTAVTAVDGVASTKLVTSPEDAGVYTITATTNVLDGASTPAAIKVTKTLYVGVTASSKATTAAVYDVQVNVKNANGATVTVYVGGKLKATKVATSNSYTFKVVSGTKGNKLVSVYVNGVRINSAYKLLK